MTAEADVAGGGKAIDANVASMAFWIASDGCCVLFEPLADTAPAPWLVITYKTALITYKALQTG